MTNPEELEQWFFKVNNFRLEKGCEFDFYEPGGFKKFHHVCRILDFKDAHFLKYTLTYPKFSRGVSTVSWTIRKSLKGSRIVLVHKHLECYFNAGMDFHPDKFKQGWTQVLGKALKDFLEQDKPSELTEGLIEDDYS